MNHHRNSISQWYFHPWFILSLYLALVIFATFQAMLLPLKFVEETGLYYTHYNNYIIFRQSFYHLLGHQDLYQFYPTEHWDYFKYTPTFAMLFGPLALLPDSAGMVLWNMLNMLPLAFAIYMLPHPDLRKKSLILLIGAIEAMTSIQSEQSNGLLAALFVFAFALCENKKFFWGIFCLTLSVFIKPFGIVGFVLFLFYPDKFKHALYTIGWAIVLGILPLMIISPDELYKQYLSWLNLLSMDHAAKYGYSVLGWFHTWFNFHPQKTLVTLIGAILFLIPFSRIGMYSSYPFRMLALASFMIWVIIFNHMAESPTFVIAMFGASIWFFAKKRGIADTILFIVVFAFISLSSTDLVPHAWRREIFRPYVLKAVPCILLWGRILLEMMLMKKESKELPDMQTI